MVYRATKNQEGREGREKGLRDSGVKGAEDREFKLKFKPEEGRLGLDPQLEQGLAWGLGFDMMVN